eukprot:UN10338
MHRLCHTILTVIIMVQGQIANIQISNR